MFSTLLSLFRKPKNPPAAVFDSQAGNDVAAIDSVIDSPVRSRAQQSGRVALWEAASAAQSGDFQLARQSLSLALASGADRKKVAQLLIGATHTSLGRASVFSSKPERSIQHFEKSQDLNAPGGSALYLDLLMSQAQVHSLKSDHLQASLAWQDIACLLGEKTPEHVYAAMGHSQAQVKGFGGSREENECWGDLHKHDVLSALHDQLSPQFYLEIGVDEGLSLARAACQAIGMDPRPNLNLKTTLPESAKIMAMSSDQFFRQQAGLVVHSPIDFAFIDGMHLFEFVLRDFINIERNAPHYGLVAIDDIYPCHPTQALRHRQSMAWTGDVWKIQGIFRQYRPDLFCVALNCWTTGMLLIAGLDSENQVLSRSYQDLVREYRVMERVPGEVLERHGAIPSDHPVVSELMALLAHAKRDLMPQEQLAHGLRELGIKVRAVEQEFMGRAKGLARPDASKSKFSADQGRL